MAAARGWGVDVWFGHAASHRPGDLGSSPLPRSTGCSSRLSAGVRCPESGPGALVLDVLVLAHADILLDLSLLLDMNFCCWIWI